MQATLKYGDRCQVQFNFASDALLADCSAPRGRPLENLAQVVSDALDAPLEFPPLRSATVPGDRIVVALEHGVPQAPQIVAALVHALVANGTSPADISIVRSSSDVDAGATDPRAELDREIASQVAVETHDPTDRSRMSYLAASEKGHSIYLNRTIFDADMVVPIGCLRPNTAVGYHGVHDAVFPTFSDQETQDRFRATDAQPTDAEMRMRRAEADEVAWLLGVLFTVQVVPGPGNSILHVLAGEPRTVFDRGSKLCQDAWSYSVPKRASLVVAAIEGASDHQTWENVGRALAAASRAVAENGSIALCTDLDVLPSSSLKRVATAEDPDRVMRKIRKERRPDVVPATQLALALERSKVYFLSRLDEEVVEELGIAHVAGAEEIARLAARHDSCIILANAQLAEVTPLDD